MLLIHHECVSRLALPFQTSDRQSKGHCLPWKFTGPDHLLDDGLSHIIVDVVKIFAWQGALAIIFDMQYTGRPILAFSLLAVNAVNMRIVVVLWWRSFTAQFLNRVVFATARPLLFNDWLCLHLFHPKLFLQLPHIHGHGHLCVVSQRCRRHLLHRFLAISSFQQVHDLAELLRWIVQYREDGIFLFFLRLCLFIFLFLHYFLCDRWHHGQSFVLFFLLFVLLLRLVLRILLLNFLFEFNLLLQLRIRINYKGYQNVEDHKISGNHEAYKEENYPRKVLISRACTIQQHNELPVVQCHDSEQGKHPWSIVVVV